MEPTMKSHAADTETNRAEKEKRRLLATLDQERRRVAPAHASAPVTQAPTPTLAQLDDLSRTAPSFAFARALRQGFEALAALQGEGGASDLRVLLERIVAMQARILADGNLADELVAARATAELMEKNCQTIETRLLDAMAETGNARRTLDELDNRLSAVQRHAAEVIRQRDTLADTLARVRREHQEALRALSAAEEEILRLTDESPAA